MSWMEQLAVLKMVGWQLNKGRARYWYIYKPNGDLYNMNTAKTSLIRNAFARHMQDIGQTE